MKYWDDEYHLLHFVHQAQITNEDILLPLPSNLVFACIMSKHFLIPFVAILYLLMGISVLTLAPNYLGNTTPAHNLSCCHDLYIKSYNLIGRILLLLLLLLYC